MGIKEIIRNQNARDDRSREHTVRGKYGMAASAVEEATEAGAQVLRDGGNAADAVIAIQLALAAVEGMNTGIGASGFITYYDAGRDETKVINAHTVAPEATEPDLFLNQENEVPPFIKRSTRAEAVGIPGIMKGMETLHDKWGTMPLERLIDPAIRLAEEPYRVDSLWEKTIKMMHYRLHDEAKKVFMPKGVPLVEGDSVTQKDLAKTLKIIQEHGFSAVYEGEIAEAITDTVRANNGLVTSEDLRNYRVSIDEPLRGSYRDYEFAFPAPPNGGGFAVAQLLKILEPFNISQYGVNSWEKYFILTEALRLTLADKSTYIADPEFKEMPIEGLLSDAYIAERRKQIRLWKRNKDISYGDPWKYQDGEPNSLVHSEPAEEGNETTHFTAVDRWGNVAACTSSIERMFGSGIMVPGYGFLLNNDLTDFNPHPGRVNEPDSGKHAVSSKTPLIAFHGGKPFLTLGSPGGSTIVSSVLQVLLHVLDYEMDLNEAIAVPRIFSSVNDPVQLEVELDDEVKKKLSAMGYDLNVKTLRIGDVQAILIDQENGILYGAADRTRPGLAIGLLEPPAGG
ncbi:gamma-glutamyltransferase [Indiicoccus explosivorum]|uniref:gamma-glutamyltransferase n=1 Tax=Indiicoccus explosivorum TaxID=1917864 RepID=UPI000B436672|nr:gamma-glutamyltransferase [Indiicoccus explosivorum]